MHSLLQDLRIAARQLARQKGFTAVVVATLGLAIGVNTLTFSFVNPFAFRPLPMKEVSRLVLIWSKHPEQGQERALSSYPDFVEWRDETTSFEDLAAAGERTYNLTGADAPLRVRGFAATASLFTEWGFDAVVGRVIRPEDEGKGAPRVALLSHGFWSRRFGADPKVVGTSLRLDGQAHVVVGVLSPSIEFGSLSEIDVWTPLTREADPAARTARTLMVSGRLRHGVDITRAAAEIQAITLRQQSDHPDTNAGWSAYVQPLRSGITGANIWVLLALMAVAVSLVLAIACANVANLMLARGTDRRRETALRTALGASRGRIVRLLLTEGLLLSVLGGGLGLLLAAWGLAFIRSMVFGPFSALVVVDRRVMAFSATISLVAPLLFGLLPALQATKLDLVTALKEGGGAVGASRRRVLGRNVLVSGQLALALALLLVAGLVVRAALALRQIPYGFDHRQLLAMRTELPEARYPGDATVRGFVAQLEERLRGLPGVERVATASGRPMFEAGPNEPLVIEDVAGARDQARPLAVKTVVGAGYFETLRITILRGRAFGPQDVPGSPLTVIVNELLVARYFSGQDPLGRRIRIGGADAPSRTVVGVAADVLNTYFGQPTAPQVYVPLDQHPVRTLAFLVRTDQPDAVVAAARREMVQLDPEQPLYDVKTMEQAFFEILWSDRLITGMFVLFASVALGMAGLGLYSLISYLVSRRTREIAVRVALGATRADVMRLVLGQGARVVLAGLGLGLLLGLGLARVMAGALVGVSSTDSVTFTLVPLLLCAVGLLAAAVPARRAARLEPATMLGAE